ncbi:MAG: chemotaxis protein CheW [Gammaproteobacteria bacterium]|nr:chemotaxis protein CheW [Gammaproteobacteria bacterium]
MTDAVNSAEPLQCVTFHLEGEIYGINVMLVQEVLRVTEIAPVPGAPDFVLGIINLRGNVVTVIDTRKRFALPAKEMDDSTRIVIIESDLQTVGIVVDGVSEVVNVSRNEIESAPSVGNDQTARYIEGVVSRGDELLILVDLNKLLTEDEWLDVGAL